ncbi:MAG TPA: hypothetical protein VK629_18145 [Steroidobacteraceae bacterium]|nr:hypothetical protein [Steroidobacteraceae bacterium]
MRIAKPMLLILTPIGVAGGLFEAYRFGGGGLLFLMLALLMLIGAALGTVVYTIRKERQAEQTTLKPKE